MWKKLRNSLSDVSNHLELVMAIFVLLGIVVAGIGVIISFPEYFEEFLHTGEFQEFLGIVFNIVIGIEFLKMLCHPSSDTVLEVLIFTVARHMIIEKTTAIENLLIIVCIAGLFAIKKYLYVPANQNGMDMFMEETTKEENKEAK